MVFILINDMESTIAKSRTACFFPETDLQLSFLQLNNNLSIGIAHSTPDAGTDFDTLYQKCGYIICMNQSGTGKTDIRFFRNSTVSAAFSACISPYS